MEHTATPTSNFRTYWMTWGALLVITLVMLVLDNAQVSRGLLLTILLGAMAVKATLIAGTFMHLKHEHSGIILTVVVGLFVMGLILYVLIVPDANRIHHMVHGS
ncbi:MAG: cytochrome C oxidase subunit IV family protein [Vicinamibacterales bacterium]